MIHFSHIKKTFQRSGENENETRHTATALNFHGTLCDWHSQRRAAPLTTSWLATVVPGPCARRHAASSHGSDTNRNRQELSTDRFTARRGRKRNRQQKTTQGLEQTISRTRTEEGISLLCGGSPGQDLWNNEDFKEIKSYVKTLPAVDHDRIYIMGHSMGGHGTYIYSIGSRVFCRRCIRRVAVFENRRFH